MIGILYICTGQYIYFFKDFYHSAEEFFLPECNKHYYVYTDSKTQERNISESDNISWIFQEQLPWPEITLMRNTILLKESQLYKSFLHKHKIHFVTQFGHVL